jgi:hypothetical protein
MKAFSIKPKMANQWDGSKGMSVFMPDLSSRSSYLHANLFTNAI